MARGVLTVEPEMSLLDAWEFLHTYQISGAPVVSEDEGLVGVISQSDLLRAAVETGLEDFPPRSYYLAAGFWDAPMPESFREKLDALEVAEVMNSRVITATPDDEVGVVAAIMRQNNIHRIIVTEFGEVVGIVTSLDLLKVLEKH